MITVILNAYKRQQFLEQQISCVLSQTVSPECILVWNNGDELDLKLYGDKVMIANHSHNTGVWSRFAYALNAQTEYVCILDDDTFPESKFFESCLKQMATEPALLGTRGLRFLSSSKYAPNIQIGWNAPNEKTEVVDIVGHAWFFKRVWLSAFWRELPTIGTSRLVGEDMHFSFMLQKYLGVRTMVPPHPLSEPEIWGSNPELGVVVGTSKDAISLGDDSLNKFDIAFRHYTSSGFKLCKDGSGARWEGTIVGPGVSNITFFRIIAQKVPPLAKLGRWVKKKLAEYKLHI
jgi:hypothetical protein